MIESMWRSDEINSNPYIWYWCDFSKTRIPTKQTGKLGASFKLSWLIFFHFLGNQTNRTEEKMKKAAEKLMDLSLLSSSCLPWLYWFLPFLFLEPFCTTISSAICYKQDFNWIYQIINLSASKVLREIIIKKSTVISLHGKD